MDLTPFLWVSPFGLTQPEAYQEAGFLPLPCGPGDLEERLHPPASLAAKAPALPVALFIAEDVPNSIQVARAAHRLAPSCRIVFLAPDKEAAAIKRELSLVSMVGTYWTADPEDIAGHLRILELCRNARNRGRRLRTTLDKLQVRLATPHDEVEASQRRLLLSDRYLASILDQARDAILSLDRAFLIVSWNKGAETLLGWRESEIVGQSFLDLAEAGERKGLESMLQTRAGSAYAFDPAEIAFRKRDGSSFPGETTFGDILDEKGILIGKSIILRDISVRKRLESDLLQSQKMEAVGRLAGGIAHDFNNLLTAINGYAELLGQELPPDDRLGQMVAEIRKSGERAANLTSQLLLYSRRQIMVPELLDLNGIVADMGRLLKRLIGENIQVSLALEPRLGKVKADRLRMEQILMNLVLNSRDAMPDGGRLTLETGNVILDADYVSTHLEAKAGPHVLLAVSDTGMGMSPDVKVHMFDPFFTTKPVGKGTGLGLASVYGAVKQFGGSIWVYSELGRGTTLKIYLPEAASAESDRIGEEMASLPSVPEVSARPGATILLVEDEDPVRGFARQVLLNAGYRVLDAAEGHTALGCLESLGEGLDLLITDIVMPGMSGKELAQEVSRRAPGADILYISGYTENAIAHHGVLDAGVRFLQKPFSQSHLLKTVESIIEGGNS